jgi:enoyl-CoA hydratase/carnithine racemase
VAFPSHSEIVVTVDGGVGGLRLNRPDRLNALTASVMSAVIEAAEWFDAQPRVRAVVISGAGDAFCAGVDIAEFGSLDSLEASLPAFRLGATFVSTVESMRPITVAALHGNVVGGGVVLAAACDLRVAAEDTSFSIPEVDLGIPLLWDAIPRLVREIGPARTRELVMTCRPFTAAEAENLGFLNRVVPAAEVSIAANALAREVAARPPVPVEMTKRQVAAALGAGTAPTDEEALGAVFTDADSRARRDEYLRHFRGR